jgi:CheY-like chemotaxis protein
MEKRAGAGKSRRKNATHSMCNMAKVVIVEDEVIVLYLLQSVLNTLKHEVLDVVADGESALKAVVKYRPDLIIMDINLRGALNGIETMQEIRLISQAPVIYTSSHAHAATIEKALSIKHSRFLNKPVTSEQLEASIQELLGPTAP